MKTVSSVCCLDCGGSCPLSIHVEDGRIRRIEARDVGLSALRPCAKGLLYHYRVYAPDRLKYPMKRVGKRGEGNFARISWDEALDKVAEQITRIRDRYEAPAILNPGFGSGPAGQLHNFGTLTRFLNLVGGQTTTWSIPSSEAIRFASLATYGRLTDTGSDRADLLSSKMIILWGCNPAQTILGTETRYHLAQAKERGAKIVCVDPMYTETAAAWGSQWIPILPGTDAAMLVAMAYVITEQGLQDEHFLNTYTVGFDRFRDYLAGVEDGIPKTAEWAEKITGVPADTVRALALEYAVTKPAAIIPGIGPGRSVRGEQYHRAAATLAAMTGNVGVHGGNAAGYYCFGVLPALPTAEIRVLKAGADVHFHLPLLSNPIEKDRPAHKYAVKGISQHTDDKVHPTQIWDGILKGKAGGYLSDIRMLYVVGGNILNQFTDSTKGVEALKSIEFMVVHDEFMTPTARFADILLPTCTWCERNDIKLPWVFGHYAIYANKAIEPLYESRTDLDIFTELAANMGVSGYNDKTEEEWLRLIAANHGIPDYDAFKASGFYKLETPEPYVAFRPQIEDPEHNPFPTPSGKIEIFCQRIADFNHPEVLPPIPKYVEGWEGPTDPKRKQYPLQLLTVHPPMRVHSQFDNVAWYREKQSREMWINPDDAKSRNIRDRSRVKLFNDRGTISIVAKVTQRVMPGVVCIYEGAWYNPDASGVDLGGCANVLTRGEHSPGGAFCSNTALVQVERA